MAELQYESESEFSESEAVYTHFRTINCSDQELSSTVEDRSVQEEEDVEKCVKFKACVLKCCEVFLLLVLITTVWLALSIPSVFFFISQTDHQNKTNTTLTPGITSCKPTQYLGSLCTDYLKSYQSCLPHYKGRVTPIVYISDSIEQGQVGIELSKKFKKLGLASDECRAALKPLACLYFFPLCDETTHTTVPPTSKQCFTLRDKICQNEWNLAKLLKVELPKCSRLPEKISTPIPINGCSINTSIMPVSPTLQCAKGFENDLSSALCRPTCGDWTPYSGVENNISNAVVIVSGAVAIISGTLVLILSCVRCKKVYSYPSIFIIYQTVPTIILGSLALIAYVDNKGLFCSSQFVQESMRNPTTFCTITGIALYYIIIQLILLWCFHVITMFWGVYWPIQASMAQVTPKRIVLHIIAVCVALVLPAIPVCIIHFIAPGGFTITRFPPILCAASSPKFNYYAFMLPLSIIIAIGLTLLVLIFWKLLKKRILHRLNQTRIDTNWCTYARILTVLCYFVVFGIIVLSSFTVSMINLEIFVVEVTEYFLCETKGLNSTNSPDPVSTCMDERESVEKLVNPIITIIGLVILGFYPAVNLVYVCHAKEIKESCLCCRATREVEHPHHRVYRPYQYTAHQNGVNSTSSSVRGVRLDTHGLI